MTEIVASAVVNADGSATIILKGQSSFPAVCNWEIEDFSDRDLLVLSERDSIHTYEDSIELMFEKENIGVGVLDQQRKRLKINISFIPSGEFLLSINDTYMKKMYNFRDIVEEKETELVVLNEIDIVTTYRNDQYWTDKIKGPAMVLISGSIDPINMGVKRAGIFKNGEQIGIAMGYAFNEIISKGGTYPETYYWTYPFPGVFFHKFFWTNYRPQQQEQLQLVMKHITGLKSGNNKFDITMSVNSATAPTSSFYDFSNVGGNGPRFYTRNTKILF